MGSITTPLWTRPLFNHFRSCMQRRRKFTTVATYRHKRCGVGYSWYKSSIDNPTSQLFSPGESRFGSFHVVDQENGKTKREPESIPSIPNYVMQTNLFSISKTSSLEPTPTENRPGSTFASTYPTVSQLYKPTLLSHPTPSEKVYVPTEGEEEEEGKEPDREPTTTTPTVSQMYQPTLFSHPRVSTSEAPSSPTQSIKNLEFVSPSATNTDEGEDLDSLSSADDTEDDDSDSSSSSSSSPTVSQMWQSTVFVRPNPSDGPLSNADGDAISSDRMLELAKFSQQQVQKREKKRLKKRLVPHSAPSFTPNRLPRNRTTAGFPSILQVRGAFSTRQRSSVAVYWGNQYTHPVAWKRKLRYMECLMSVNVTYNRLPDNHTLVVLTAGGYVV